MYEISTEFVNFNYKETLKESQDPKYVAIVNQKEREIKTKEIEHIRINNLPFCIQKKTNEICYGSEVENKDVYMKRTDSIHEYFVSSFVTNHIQSNFAYMSHALSNIKASNEDIININSIAYRVGNCFSLHQFVKSCTFSQFINTYLQVLYSLHKANKIAHFTHYNLTDENVLIEHQKEPKRLPYMTEKGEEIIKADYVANIINFSLSHVMYEKEHYGNHGALTYFVFPELCYPLYDAYKLLLYSMNTMKKYRNYECFKMCSSILKYFNKFDKPKDILRDQYSFKYSLPYLKKIANQSMLHFTSYIRSLYKLDFIKVDQYSSSWPERKLDISSKEVDNDSFIMFSLFVSSKDTIFDDTIFELYKRYVIKFLTKYETINSKSKEIAINSFCEDINYLNILKEDDSICDFLDKNEKYKWYYRELRRYMFLVK